MLVDVILDRVDSISDLEGIMNTRMSLSEHIDIVVSRSKVFKDTCFGKWGERPTLSPSIRGKICSASS
jgi:hypothetical protein